MIRLNSRQRDRYIVMCAAIDTIQNFCDERSFSEFSPKARATIKTALTNLKKTRDTLPNELDLASCKSLLNDIKSYNLVLNYTGSSRYYVNAKEVDDLLAYAIRGACKDCKLIGKAVKNCEFKKTWNEALVETDEEQRSCECKFSFKSYI